MKESLAFFTSWGMLSVCACPRRASGSQTHAAAAKPRPRSRSLAGPGQESPSGQGSGSSFAPSSRRSGQALPPPAAGSSPGVIFAATLKPCAVPWPHRRDRRLQTRTGRYPGPGQAGKGWRRGMLPEVRAAGSGGRSWPRAERAGRELPASRSSPPARGV